MISFCQPVASWRFAALMALVAFYSATALAERPTMGVASGLDDPISGDHAESVEVNPAGLGFGEKLQLSYGFTHSGERAPGDGHGIFTSFGFLGPYRSGLGLQLLAGPQTTAQWPMKLSWSHALRLSPRLAVGFTWHRLQGKDLQGLDGLETFDLGFQYRMGKWLTISGASRDFTRPSPIVLDGGVPTRLGRNWLGGVSIRPGTQKLTFTAFGEMTEQQEDVSLGARLRWWLLDGLGLVARYERHTVEGSDAHRLMVGLADSGQFDAGFMFYGSDLARSGKNAGFSMAARLRSRKAPFPRVLSRPMVVEVPIGNVSEYQVNGFFQRKVVTPFLNLLNTLRSLAERPDVHGVLLTFGSSNMGWAQASEIRMAINNLKARGKKVYAWLSVADTRIYSVATAADKVFLAPAGGLLITGIRGESLHIAEFLERFGVKPEFVTTGAYKSAPEMFTRTGPSPASRAMQNELLDDLYNEVVGHLADGRSMKKPAMLKTIDGAPYTAHFAREAGLIDGVHHYDELEGVLRGVFGSGLRFSRASRILDVRDRRWGQRPAVGILYATGTIVDGPSLNNPLFGSMTTGSETFVRAADQLRLDSKVKAVVLRVESPGGSITAADAMWRSLVRLAAVKPLIVSMGDVAASGGYYIAAPGKLIFASPETITGSIGVFYGKFDLSGLYEGLGVHKELYLRGARSAAMSEVHPWSEQERETVQKNVNSLYDLFLQRVASGRQNLSKKQVRPLAGGRVWTGNQAQSCGLVDRHGGFLEAIDTAAKLASLNPDDVRYELKPAPGGFGGIPKSPLGHLTEFLAKHQVGQLMQTFMPTLTALARMPVLMFPRGTTLALLPWMNED